MKKIGNSFDALTSLKSELLDIEEKEQKQKELEKELKKIHDKALLEEFNLLFGFKSFEEALAYIKDYGKWVGSGVQMFKWDPEKKRIRYMHQISDEYDAWFQDVIENITEYEFLHLWDDVIKEFKERWNEDRTYNKYGNISFIHKELTDEEYQKYKDVIWKFYE